MESLPLEVQYMIFEHLAIRDLLSLWMASPTIPDRFPQRFWRSRFQPNTELGYLFGAVKLWSIPKVDWYALFWGVREQSSPGVQSQIRNRRRIISIIDQNSELVSKYGDRLPEGRDDHIENPTLLETDGVYLHQKSLAVPAPADVESLHVSIVYLNGRDYVSGLRINDVQHELGYYHPETSQTFQLVSAHGRAREILLYMDRVCIRGIALVTDDGWSTGMTPSPETRLQLSEGVLPLGEHLVGQFDVRIPSIAGSGLQTLGLTTRRQSSSKRSVSVVRRQL